MAENGENAVRVLPWDEENRLLVARVRPPGWVNPKPAARYNLVVIGAGTAGLVAAAGAAGLGAKVALVERRLMGGDCLNTGCVPSKALIEAARTVAAVRRAAGFGILVPEGVQVDFGAVMARLRRLRAAIAANDSAERFRGLGVDVFFGEARFIDPHTVEAAGERLRFKKALIATGSRPAIPPIPGIETVDFLTHETLFSLTELPRRLAVIGAGPIGCEMAQAFARFGAEVRLIEAAHGILPREEGDASALVLEALRQDGVEVLCCGRELSLSPAEDGRVRLAVTSHGVRREERVDRLLLAAGRAANVAGLGLEAAGVAFTEKGVTVNDRLQTTHPDIYAAGDVCSAFQFTHAADFMARLVLRNALFFGRAGVGSLTIPWCTYTDPEIAHVGLTPAQAAEKGIALETYTQPLTEVDRAVLAGETSGMVRIHVRKGSDRIAGATIVAPHAGDLIAEIALAMTHGLGLSRIAATIHPYPTFAEAIRRAGDAWNRGRLTPKVKRWFSRWMALRR